MNYNSMPDEMIGEICQKLIDEHRYDDLSHLIRTEKRVKKVCQDLLNRVSLEDKALYVLERKKAIDLLNKVPAQDILSLKDLLRLLETPPQETLERLVGQFRNRVDDIMDFRSGAQRPAVIKSLSKDSLRVPDPKIVDKLAIFNPAIRQELVTYVKKIRQELDRRINQFASQEGGRRHLSRRLLKRY